MKKRNREEEAEERSKAHRKAFDEEGNEAATKQRARRKAKGSNTGRSGIKNKAKT